MATYQTDEQLVASTSVTRYIFTRTSFVKREIPLNEREMSRSTGLPVAQRWEEQRFRNEAAALELVSTNTTIPVPKLLSWGRDGKGLLFLETELLQRSVLCDMAGDHCRMPKLHGATTGECVDCRRIARDNANRFIYDSVLPQLQTLKHNTTGLNGFVIPPRWVT
ncbi:hypothetical protein JX266_010078 [Neoarthrinium moseri]|nr:hypothetical protein JX266_010078 [Neoarthrinium moseri]